MRISYFLQYNSHFVIDYSDPKSVLDKCVEACEKTSCGTDLDTKKGCNQMYSCAHACKLRHLGQKEDECRNHCNRRGNSGCKEIVNGWEFELCGKCNRNGCSTHPTQAECEIGCASYGKLVKF